MKKCLFLLLLSFQRLWAVYPLYTCPNAPQPTLEFNYQCYLRASYIFFAQIDSVKGAACYVSVIKSWKDTLPIKELVFTQTGSDIMIRAFTTACKTKKRMLAYTSNYINSHGTLELFECQKTIVEDDLWGGSPVILTLFYPRGTYDSLQNVNYSRTEMEREISILDQLSQTQFGQIKSYYANGKLAFKASFWKGKPVGKRQVFFPNGELWMEEKYKKGKLVEERYFVLIQKQDYQNREIKRREINRNLPPPDKEGIVPRGYRIILGIKPEINALTPTKLKKRKV